MTSVVWRPFAAVAGAAAAVFAVLAALVETAWSPLADLDSDVTREAYGLTAAHPAWADVNLVLTDWVWDTTTLRLITLAAALALWLRGARRLAAWAVCVMLGGAALGALLKVLFARPRPAVPDPVTTAHGWSLPSGHAMTGMLAAGVLLVIVLPYVRRGAVRGLLWGLAAVSVAGVGWTRVAVGVHYLSDVVAGWILGVAVLAAVTAAFRWAAARTAAHPDGG